MQIKKPSIGIIGGGISGLTLAVLLKPYFGITLFEKSRSLGGRLATTYNNQNCQFDIGAQFFVAKTEGFKKFLQPYIENESLRCWHGDFLEIKNPGFHNRSEWTADFPHWVPSPKMTSLCKSMSDGINVITNQKIISVEKINDQVRVKNENTDTVGMFDYALLTTPPKQAADMLTETSSLFHKLNNLKMDRCISVSLAFNKPIELNFAAALVKGSDISFISNNRTKPGRELFSPSLTILSSNQYANTNFTKNDDLHINHLKQQAEIAITKELPPSFCHHIHYWRYANRKGTKQPSCLFDNNLNIGYCSDGLTTGKVECAFLNAKSLAENILARK